MLVVEIFKGKSITEHRVEIVERKGTGHPDQICDSIMEAISLALCREYLERFGTILHHNVDKGLLAAGRAVCPAPEQNRRGRGPTAVGHCPASAGKGATDQRDLRQGGGYFRAGICQYQ